MISRTRIEELLLAMSIDQPTGGVNMTYGSGDAQYLRYWKPKSPNAPIVLFVHGGSWRSGTYLDLIGSPKITHLTGRGYVFAIVNYTLIPSATMEEQVQVADLLVYLVRNAATLDFDPQRVILMEHSSGAHIATLLRTDERYSEKAGIDIYIVRAVISLDGSNYNAVAEITDSSRPVAESTIRGLGTDPKRPKDEGFEDHLQMPLRLGDSTYPATLVMNNWLKVHVPVTIPST